MCIMKKSAPLPCVISKSFQGMGSSNILFLTEIFLSPAQCHAFLLEAVSITLLQFRTSNRFQTQQKESLYPIISIFDLPSNY